MIPDPLIAFLAGAATLVVELVWMRLLSLALGSASFASGAVVAAIMLGMAIGSAMSARAVERPRRRLGFDLLALAFAAVVSAPIIRSFGHPGILGTIAIGFFMTAASIPMGKVVPLLAAGGRSAGALYAVNTLGSSLGALAAGFLLLPFLGNLKSLLTAAVPLVALGLSLVLRKEATLPAATASTESPRGRPAGILLVYALSALAAMVSEIGWMRALVLSIGSSTYAFTLVLTVYIAGLGIGSALASRRLNARPAVVFGAIQLLLALSCLVSLLFLGRLPALLGPLVFNRISSLGSFALVGLLVSTLAILLPTLFVGAAFPVAVRWVALRTGPARAPGLLLAAATGGSTLGALVASFVSIPLIGVEKTLGAALLLHAIAGSIVLSGAEGRRRLWPSLAAAAVMAVVFLRPPWDPRLLQSGPYINDPFDWKITDNESRKIVFSRDDRVATVAVFELLGGNRILRIDGKTDASMSQIDQVTQLLTAHIPLAIHGHAKRVAVIGLGSGMTVASCLRYQPEEVHCIEISPAVVRASRFFDDYTGAPLTDPRVRLHTEDARAVIGRRGPSFDVIINEPSNLWIAGMAGLFTEEFYRSAAARLEEGGLMCQWIHAYGITEPVFKDAIATFLKVFPHVTLWEIVVSGDYLLLGSTKPYVIDADDLARQVARPAVYNDLRWISVRTAGAILGDLVAATPDLQAFVAGSRIQTDDDLHLEFTAPLGFFGRKRVAALNVLPDVRRESLAPLLRGRGVEWDEARTLLRDAIRGMTESRDPIDQLRLLQRALERFPEERQARLLLDIVAEQCVRASDHAALTGDPARAAACIEAVPPGSRWYPAARFRRIATLRKEKAPARALGEEYRKILDAAPGLETAIEPYAEMLLTMGATEEAERVVREGAVQNPKSAKIRLVRGKVLAEMGRRAEAVTEWEEALKLDPSGPSGREAAKRLNR